MQSRGAAVEQCKGDSSFPGWDERGRTGLLGAASALALEYVLGVHSSSHVVTLHCGRHGSDTVDLSRPTMEHEGCSATECYLLLRVSPQETFIKTCAAPGPVVGALETGKSRGPAVMGW